MVWTGLFLAVLAGGEIALDFCHDRNLRAWRSLVILTGAFVTLLGILRFWFLATIGTNGLVRRLPERSCLRSQQAGSSGSATVPCGQLDATSVAGPQGGPPGRGKQLGPPARRPNRMPRKGTVSSRPTLGTLGNAR